MSVDEFNKAVLDLEELDPVVTFSDGEGTRLALCYHKGIDGLSIAQGYWADEATELKEITRVFLNDYSLLQLKKLLEGQDAN